jgi:PIN domain nuclease of toxin-antitoxin system
MILDTCALLWLAEGAKKLSRATLKHIEQAPFLSVSAISGFEIAIKCHGGKLKLPLTPKKWFRQVTQHHGVGVLPLDQHVCIRAAELPPIHEDPCDRFIIATALIQNLDVVTSDDRFSEYGVHVLN